LNHRSNQDNTYLIIIMDSYEKISTLYYIIFLLILTNIVYAQKSFEKVIFRHQVDTMPFSTQNYPVECSVHTAPPHNYECDISTDIPKQKRNYISIVDTSAGEDVFIYIYNNLNKVVNKKKLGDSGNAYKQPQQGDIIGYIDDINNIEIIKVDCRKCFLRKYGHLDMYEFEIDKTELENFNQKTDPIYEIIDYNHISP
jgi:hypothetical protein